jgi:dGTPase
MNWNDLLNNGRLRPSKRNTTTDSRNDFESDFGRIIFSAATRRMHDKTQVFPLTTDDNIHSRLTHSMEVMSIGHSLGIRVCEEEKFRSIVGKTKTDLFREIPVLIKNACLVHDIGNPPFGHFGERVIQTFFKKLFSIDAKSEKYIPFDLNREQKEDFTEFDGNAQGFRVLTKLQSLNDRYGLNLTFATLAAYLKYPNSGLIDKKIINRKKRGVFQSEVGELKRITKECNLTIGDNHVRHPLCYLMEAADSICYLVMDIEDGFNKGLFKFDFIEEKLSKIDGVSAKIKHIRDDLNGYGDNITLMVNFRIYLIQRLVTLAVDNFIKNYESIEEGSYNNELIYDDPAVLASTLQNFCINYIFPDRDITSLELTGHSVLSGLLDYYIQFIFKGDDHYRRRAQGLISRSIIRAAFIENGLREDSDINHLNDYYKLRVIVDFISGMTDQYAVDHFQKLSGQKI